VKVAFATRLEADLRQRLRVFVAVTGRTVENVVGEALDGYLPAVPVDVAQGARSRENALVTGQPEWPQGHNEAAPAR
jgi:hypothetical protein